MTTDAKTMSSKDFVVAQAISRAKIRIKENRAEMLDFLLAVDQSLSSLEYFYHLREEMRSLTVEEILSREFKPEDFEVIDNLNHNEYWKAVHYLVKSRSNAVTRDGVVPVVKTQMAEMFSKKTVKELEVLRTQIEEKLENGGSNVDLDYWDSCLRSLQLTLAKLRVQEAIDSLDFNTVSKADDATSEQEVFTKAMNPTYSNAIMPSDMHRQVYTPEEDHRRLQEERKLILEKLKNK